MTAWSCGRWPSPCWTPELARHPEFGPELRGLDMEPVLAFAREVLAEQPRTGGELRALFATRFPNLHPGALAYACRNHLAFVQVPPRGVWGRSAQVRSTTAETWLGRSLVAAPSIDEVVMRYFAAFGPASVADVSTWSRLTGLREVVERLRPSLRTFRDERGRELFDAPDAPRPDPDTSAPTRFLPEYDNLLLSHADRRRFAPGHDPDRKVVAIGPVHGTVLHDGVLFGTWSIDRDNTTGTATLTVRAFDRPTPRSAAAVEAEAVAVLGFLESEATSRDLRLVSGE